MQYGSARILHSEQIGNGFFGRRDRLGELEDELEDEPIPKLGESMEDILSGLNNQLFDINIQTQV